MSGPTIVVVSLRYAALGLLAQQPGSGYDLLKRFENSMANVWPATQSQLYGELNKLADAGLIEVTDIGPRGRKEYRVTKAGREDLLRWMTAADDDPPFRSAGLLRVFLLGEMPPDLARAHVVAARRARRRRAQPGISTSAIASTGTTATPTSMDAPHSSTAFGAQSWKRTGRSG